MRHILSILVENEAGALSRISGLFSARGYNIESLTVAPTEDATMSRMTIVTSGSDDVIEQITKQLNKLIPVIKIVELGPDEGVERELMLATVKTGAETRSQVTELASIFEARIVDVGFDAMTVMVAGAPARLDAFSDLLAPLGIVELQRTGRIALPRLVRNPGRLRAVRTRSA